MEQCVLYVMRRKSLGAKSKKNLPRAQNKRSANDKFAESQI
jgi:hypothetical protein